jgi:16S rRNA (cytosine1402-N4)-methyltransferase
MFINDELGQLATGLTAAFAALAPGGRLAVISFHSLEDRAVKQYIATQSGIDPALARLPVIPPSAQPRMKRVGSKYKPQAEELARNPRARSAILRVAEKLA